MRSEAQLRADAKYRERNREKLRIGCKKSNLSFYVSEKTKTYFVTMCQKRGYTVSQVLRAAVEYMCLNDIKRSDKNGNKEAE